MAKKKHEEDVAPVVAPGESVIQTEGKAHHEDTGKADKNITPRPAEEGISEQKAKSKRKEKPEEKTSVFPADAQINDYGFLHFKKSWLENLGWINGMPLKIEKNADGSITLRKA